MKYLFILIFLFIHLKTYCQDINGFWVGEINNSKSQNVYLKYPIAFEIKFDSVLNIISGINTTISFDSIYANFKITGYLQNNKRTYYLEETELLESSNASKDSVIRNYFLLEFAGKNKLKGEWFCFNPQVNALCRDIVIIILKRKSLPKNKVRKN